MKPPNPNWSLYKSITSMQVEDALKLKLGLALE